MSNFKKMISYYKPYKKVFFADIFFALIEAGTVLVIPVLVRYNNTRWQPILPSALLADKSYAAPRPSAGI